MSPAYMGILSLSLSLSLSLVVGDTPSLYPSATQLQFKFHLKYEFDFAYASRTLDRYAKMQQLRRICRCMRMRGCMWFWIQRLAEVSSNVSGYALISRVTTYIYSNFVKVEYFFNEIIRKLTICISLQRSVYPSKRYIGLTIINANGLMWIEEWYWF